MTKNKNQNDHKDQKDIKYTSGYFAYARTCFGFTDYFKTIFEYYNVEKIYKIKNCDNKYFLNEIFENASEKYNAECFLCPSDLSRFDCIIIKELKTAVISENADINFSAEKYPAIIENIIDFGNFYDETKLSKHKKEILELISKKEESDVLTHKFLKSANEISESTIKLSGKYINHEKIDLSVERLANKHVNEKSLQKIFKKNPSDEYRFINYISSAGIGESDIFEKEAKKIFYIFSENFLGWYYTKKIIEKFLHLNKVICPDALNPDRINAVYLKDLKILFVIKDKIPDKIYDDKYSFINMERFVSADFKKENKQKLRFTQKCYKSIIDEIIKYFIELDKINKEIEDIYASSVNPAKIKEKNKYTEAVIKKILP